MSILFAPVLELLVPQQHLRDLTGFPMGLGGGFG